MSIIEALGGVITNGKIPIRKAHDAQRPFVESESKRIIVKAGRRGGKTVGAAIKAVRAFNKGLRVLYAAPTSEQTDAFWFEVCRSLAEPIADGVLKKDETDRTIEVLGTKQRIKARTAWHPDHLRGDYADVLILDEYQLQSEDIWDVVGQPMLADNDGDALFIYTPRSLFSTTVSKARDPRHASKMFARAKEDTSGEWAWFHFSSHKNPHISEAGLARITRGMSSTAYKQEILADDEDIQDSWLIYGVFDYRTCVVPRFPIPKEWPRFVGHDFGGANPAALFVAQDPSTGLFYAYHEYLPGGGRSAYEHAVEFKRLTDGLTVLKRAGGSHQEEEVRQAYTAQGWPISEPRIGNVTAGIDRVRGLMEHNRFYVFEDLKHLLEQIYNYLWDIGPDSRPTDKIKDKERFHLLDCLRYIASDFMPELVGREAEEVWTW